MIDCFIFFVRKIHKKETEIPEKNMLSKIVLILNETFRKFPVVLFIHVFNTQILNCIPTTCISFLKIQLCLKEFMSLLNVSAISYIRVLYIETTIEDIYFQHCQTITL